MAISNRDRVGRGLELLARGLGPFVERELRAEFGTRTDQVVTYTLAGAAGGSASKGSFTDVQSLLKLMWEQWNAVFRKKLSQNERTLVSELRETRNRWAHQEAFSTDDTDRALDSMKRLLQAVSAEEATQVDRMRQEILRIRFDEQAKKAGKQASLLTEGTPAAGLLPWREIVTPHPDVASGNYQQAEFAADLGQVFRGEGSDEYRDPQEFFRRTYQTEGLRTLLTRGLARITGEGGEPVVALQTNFGGGKTHSLLALYHLFSGIAPADLPGIEPVLKEAGISQLPAVNRAVLVGTAISPGRVHEKPDGTKVKSLWGELAWQLGGAEGYGLVAEDDANGTNPGTQLNELFKRYSPCLVLIDEWVAYARQLYKVDGLPAGSFDAHFTFAQALTDAAKSVPGTFLVISLPESNIEIGGEGGAATLEKLANVVGREDSPWRPALPEESFEIVRRRLFESIEDPHAFAERDAVVKAFGELYRGHAAEFPSGCREADYERRVKAAYPLHPELFDRLYEDWSTLENFQRTRGVLRLMAAVIHSLWERQDKGLLIMPGTVPIDDTLVQSELTRYLADNWVPIIERDVDGSSSLPLELDRANPALGRYSATRRVARTIFLGSAPTVGTAHRGLEDQQVKLGCVQPGEGPAVFGDALRRLSDRAFYLYADGTRYWYSVQQTISRRAHERAGQFKEDEVHEEITKRLRADRQRGDFAGVHVAPESLSDVPDEAEARLVVLGPAFSHGPRVIDSAAAVRAREILQERSAGPRLYRNMLVFAAPDKTRLAELEDAVRQYLAWKDIVERSEELNLDAFNRNQATSKQRQFDETVVQRLRETYIWTLSPSQPDPQGDVMWEELKLQPAQEPLPERAGKKLRSEEHLIVQYAPTLLRRDLDRIPLWEGDHVSIRKLWDDYAQYLYLPRLRDSGVLLEAIRDGIGSMTWNPETFGYAEGHDDTNHRYVGLKGGQHAGVIVNAMTLLVKPAPAAEQLSEEAATRPITAVAPGSVGGPALSDVSKEPGAAVIRRFFGSKKLEAVRLAGEAGTIATEIVQHLTKLSGARVEVTVEIQAEVSSGVPEDVVRTVSENARTLGFDPFGFEAE